MMRVVPFFFLSIYSFFVARCSAAAFLSDNDTFHIATTGLGVGLPPSDDPNSTGYPAYFENVLRQVHGLGFRKVSIINYDSGFFLDRQETERIREEVRGAWQRAIRAACFAAENTSLTFSQHWTWNDGEILWANKAHLLLHGAGNMIEGLLARTRENDGSNVTYMSLYTFGQSSKPLQPIDTVPRLRKMADPDGERVVADTVDLKMLQIVSHPRTPAVGERLRYYLRGEYGGGPTAPVLELSRDWTDMFAWIQLQIEEKLLQKFVEAHFGTDVVGARVPAQLWTDYKAARNANATVQAALRTAIKSLVLDPSPENAANFLAQLLQGVVDNRGVARDREWFPPLFREYPAAREFVVSVVRQLGGEVPGEFVQRPGNEVLLQVTEVIGDLSDLHPDAQACAQLRGMIEVEAERGASAEELIYMAMNALDGEVDAF